MFKFLLAILIIFCTHFHLPVQAYESEFIHSERHNTQYIYDSYNRLQAIENYTISDEGCHQLFYTERFDWDSTHTDKLSSRILENSEGTPLISQAFNYDEKGEVTEEILGIGNLETFEEYSQEGPEQLNFNTFQTLDGSIEVGRYGQKEVAENCRITFINGIMNAKEDLLYSAQIISKSHGHAPVHYVFQPTEGWTWDLLKSSLSKLGFISSHSRALAQLWKSLIEEMGGPEGGGTIIHYAHSIGGTNTLGAKFLLTPEEQQMIQVITLGSPTMIPNEDFQSVINYVSVHDWVTLLDPRNLILSYFRDYAHIICVGDRDNPPITTNFFVDHLLDDETYKSLIISHGQKFIELFTKFQQR